MEIRFNYQRIAFAVAAVCVIGALSWVRAARGEGGEPRYFAIANARIVPVSGAVIESGTVVIAKGLIQAVGTNVSIPPEAWVIDGKGLTVYPGLIDAGTDLGLPKPPGTEVASAGHGSAGGQPPIEVARGPEARPATSPWRVAADELKIDDKRIQDWRNAGFTTALTTPDVGIFPGQGTIIDLGGERAGQLVVKPAATLQISLVPTSGFFGFPNSLMGTIAYVRQVFDDATWYQQAEPIHEANATKIERIPYDRAERAIAAVRHDNEILLLPANTSVQLLRALRLSGEWKFPTVIYSGQQGYAVADSIAARRIPVLVNLKWPERAKDGDPEAEQTLRELRFRDHAPSTPAVFVKAGVKFAFYSGGLAGPKDIFKSVKKATDAGLAPDAALRAFTLDAAEILGVADRMGSIEQGKIANLVVTDGDIFNDKTKVKHVFVDGGWYEIHEEAKPPEKAGDKKPERADVSASVGAEVSR
ncbi:MAG: amidohydrolase family protein [Candidatus Acidiferrales bacterium]